MAGEAGSGRGCGTAQVPRLIWTPNALADVGRLHGWLKDKDAEAASRAVAAIRAGVRILGQSPHVGRPAEDMDPEYREKLIDFGNSGYVALYRLDGDTAAILAVRHQKEAGFPDYRAPAKAGVSGSGGRRLSA